MLNVTPFAGCTAPTTPITVAVSVVVPPKVGLLDAVTPIVGICFASVKV